MADRRRYASSITIVADVESKSNLRWLYLGKSVVRSYWRYECLTLGHVCHLSVNYIKELAYWLSVIHNAEIWKYGWVSCLHSGDIQSAIREIYCRKSDITTSQLNNFTPKSQSWYKTVNCMKITAFWNQREYVPLKRWFLLEIQRRHVPEYRNPPCILPTSHKWN
jgi:hypothetical protein